MERDSQRWRRARKELVYEAARRGLMAPDRLTTRRYPQGPGRSVDFCQVASDAPRGEDVHVVAAAAMGGEAALDFAALRDNPLHVAEAEREMLRRSVVSTVTQSVMFLVVLVWLDTSSPSALVIACSLLFCSCLMVRLWAFWHVRHRGRESALRRRLFGSSAIGTASAWGLLSGSHFATHAISTESMIVTVFMGGITMGVMLTFAPNRELQLATIFALLLPVPIVELSRDGLGPWGFMHLAYLGYAAAQGKVIHRDFWRAIGTSDLLARHAESLRQANAERKQLQENLRFAERMASLGTLAAGVAHEINNPMTYVLGNLEYIAEELKQQPVPAWGSADPSLEQLVAEAQDGARRVVRIVRDLKTFSRQSDNDPLEPLDLESALDTAADMVRAQIRHRARLERDYRGDTLVLGDNVRLGQVFVNLVVNAVQAIPDGSDPERHRITLRTYLDDKGHAVAEVEDTGTGIEPAHMARLFDPFFTTKPIGIGTGLGLSSAMGIVSALGGTIDVESQVGVGTKVRVRLPHLSGEQQLRQAG